MFQTLFSVFAQTLTNARWSNLCRDFPADGELGVRVRPQEAPDAQAVRPQLLQLGDADLHFQSKPQLSGTAYTLASVSSMRSNLFPYGHSVLYKRFEIQMLQCFPCNCSFYLVNIPV